MIGTGIGVHALAANVRNIQAGLAADVSPYLDSVLTGVLAHYTGLDEASADGTGTTWADALGNTDWLLNASAINTDNPDWDAAKSRWIANHDGYLEFDNQSGPTEFLNAHRNVSGNELSIIVYEYHNEPDTGGSVASNGTSSGYKGLGITSQNANRGRWLLNDGGASSTMFNVAAGFVPSPQFMIITVKPTETVDNVEIWLNSRTSFTLSFTFSSDDVYDAVAAIWAYTNSSGVLTGTVNDGRELAQLAFVDHALNQEEAEAAIDYFQTYTGEPIALDDIGSVTDVEYVAVHFYRDDNTNFWIHDFSVRDSAGNDIIFGLASDSNDNATCRQEVAGGKYAGRFTNLASRIDTWNDAEWSDGDDPVANAIIAPVTVTNETNIRSLWVLMEASEAFDLGSINFYLDNAATNYPTNIDIYTQDGKINSLMTFPADTDDYTYTDGGDKRAYQISVT